MKAVFGGYSSDATADEVCNTFRQGRESTKDLSRPGCSRWELISTTSYSRVEKFA